MATETEMPDISFSGSESVKKAASRAYEVMRARGMFMSDNAPIRARKDDLIAFLTDSGISAGDAEKALTENSSVFSIETDDEGDEIVITTRLGVVPTADTVDTRHSLVNRLMTPQPKPDKPAMPVRERVSVDPSWATFTLPDFDTDEYDDEDVDVLADVAVDEAPAAAEIEAATEEAPVASDVVEPMAEVVEKEAEAPVETPVEPEQVAEPVIDIADVPELPASEVEAPVAEPETARKREPIIVPPVVSPPTRKQAPAPAAVEPSTDFTGIDDASIAAALQESLSKEIHVAHFGDQWMSEDRVQRLSRGELRRIKEYIEEQEQPLTDESLVQDILGVRANNPDYSRVVFSINYRLSKEKDFEFVGTNDQRFWATTSLPSIGTDRRKHNDIGTDFRYLVEEVPEDVQPRSADSADHIVTFYEQTLGLLPYDAEMQKLMPAPLLPEQRTAVFTFEIPQTYTTYLVELRYPTPNRGGFLLGLDDFYGDCIVPGAVISISATDNDGHYKVEYLAADDQEDRLLELDDRRSPRYVFRPTTFTCAVDDKWLINEDRFPNLGSEKPLPDKIRRRGDEVLRATFERIGMDDGEGGKLAAFEDLLTAINIERPFSEEALRAALEAEADVTGDDANGYTYAPAS